MVDEHDPFASDPELDMYDERNGYRTPPEPRAATRRNGSSATAPAQRARVARIDAIARRHMAEADHARAASSDAGFRGGARGTPLLDAAARDGVRG